MTAWLAAIPAAIKLAGGLASAIGASGLFGGGGSDGYSSSAAAHQAQLQYEWGAKSQQWTYENQIPLQIAAAKKAGIHPLAALGMQFNPQQISIGGAYKSKQGVDWSNMGQAFSRVLAAFDGLEMEHRSLINEKLRAEIDAMKEMRNPSQQPKPVIAADEVQLVASQKETSNAQDPSRSAAVNPSLQQVITPGGHLRAVYSERIGDAVEQDHIGNIDLQSDRLAEKWRQIVNGLRYPDLSPHEIDPNYPKSWIWKKVRTATGPAWKAVPHTRVPPKDRPGYKVIPHKKRNLPQGGYKWGRVKKQYR